MAAGNAAPNPICAQITANISARVGSIKSLRSAYETSASAPPTSVKSALEDMFGTRQPNAEMRNIEHKIKLERKAAEDLNDMLRSQSCAIVDIDSLLASQPAQARARPEAPKAVMPDDLMRTPRH